MIEMPDLWELELDTNSKIEKYMQKLREKGLEYDETDDEYRKNVAVPKTGLGSNLNFELSSEPCFNTNLPTERDFSGDEKVETKLSYGGGAMEMGEICSPDKVQIFKSETKAIKLNSRFDSDDSGDEG
jgi:hypothetical protein